MSAFKNPHSPDQPKPPLSRPSSPSILPLSEAENQRIAQIRQDVHTHAPEMLGFIKELHGFGMIEGWRAVEDFQIYPTETEAE